MLEGKKFRLVPIRWRYRSRMKALCMFSLIKNSLIKRNDTFVLWDNCCRITLGLNLTEPNSFEDNGCNENSFFAAPDFARLPKAHFPVLFAALVTTSIWGPDYDLHKAVSWPVL